MGFPISKADIAAFKLADDISFHTQPDGASSIRATVRAKSPKGNSPFGTPEKTRETQCESMLRDYAREYSDTPPVKSVRAFEMIHAAKWCDAWQTIAGFVREGDELTLYWQRNASNFAVYDHSKLVGDRLTLNVWRGMKKFAFLIEVQVGEDNTARMVQAA